MSGTRCAVILPVLKGAAQARDPKARLSEALGLARAIRLKIVTTEIVGLKAPRPATYLGSGKVVELGERIVADEVEVCVVDTALTPVQQRNLEKAWHCKVIDRTALILEIFGERARTREGRLQVELAALNYQRSRLVRSWTHLERQRGGFGFLGGPGESQIEADRRLIAERITRIRRELEQVTRTRGLHRAARRRVPYPIVALVGYTNSGKSTLFNRLTGAEIFAEDQLFATLDPTMRQLTLPSGRKVILSDTVGFVSELPTELIAAFRATLEEVLEADLLVHVRDISHPDTDMQRDDVLGVLRDLGLAEDIEGRLSEALNKIDRLDAEERLRLRARVARNPDQEAISAVTGEGCEELATLIEDRLRKDRRVEEICLSTTEGEAIAWLYAHGDVEHRRDEDSLAILRVTLDSMNAARFEQLFGEGRQLLSGEEKPLRSSA